MPPESGTSSPRAEPKTNTFILPITIKITVLLGNVLGLSVTLDMTVQRLFLKGSQVDTMPQPDLRVHSGWTPLYLGETATGNSIRLRTSPLSTPIPSSLFLSWLSNKGCYWSSQFSHPHTSIQSPCQPLSSLLSSLL